MGLLFEIKEGKLGESSFWRAPWAGLSLKKRPSTQHTCRPQGLMLAGKGFLGK